MIEFAVDVQMKKCSVKWSNTEDLKEVYLFIKPITPIKSIWNDSLKLEDLSKPMQPFKVIPKSRIYFNVEFPDLGNATYQFMLFDNPQADGDPIKSKTFYLGTKLPLKIYRTKFDKDFEELTVSCKYKIERELFWLSFAVEQVGGYFYMPVMEKRDKEYVTSCFLKNGVYEKMRIRLDKSILDFIIIEET